MGFPIKKPKGAPAKADPEKQVEFIRYYENLLNTLSDDEPVEFADAVHHQKRCSRDSEV